MEGHCLNRQNNEDRVKEGIEPPIDVERIGNMIIPLFCSEVQGRMTYCICVLIHSKSNQKDHYQTCFYNDCL